MLLHVCMSPPLSFSDHDLRNQVTLIQSVYLQAYCNITVGEAQIWTTHSGTKEVV